MDPEAPSFREAFLFWLKLGFISFGGPGGQIAIMHEELVVRKKWVDEKRFSDCLNFCILLPGPEATQLAIYIGWLLHGFLGGFCAGILFILPSIFILWGLSYAYVIFGTVTWVSALFYGLKAAVVAIVLHALFKLSKRTGGGVHLKLISLFAFIGLWFHVPFPVIVLAGALLGFFLIHPQDKNQESSNRSSTSFQHHLSKPRFGGTLATILVFMLIWWIPVMMVGFSTSFNSTSFHLGVFFSKAAMVTFGGAYAVLPYVQEHAVHFYNWLTNSQMIDGLGLAETTPGPLIMVLQFVGFLAGWNHPDWRSPLLSGTIAALLTTWVTFVPCFMWIFVGAPYYENLKDAKPLRGVLTGVSAAVVGVIAHLFISFGRQVVLPAGGGKPDYVACTLIVVAAFALWKWRLNLLTVVIGSGVLGWAISAWK